MPTSPSPRLLERNSGHLTAPDRLSRDRAQAKTPKLKPYKVIIGYEGDPWEGNGTAEDFPTSIIDAAVIAEYETARQAVAKAMEMNAAFLLAQSATDLLATVVVIPGKGGAL